MRYACGVVLYQPNRRNIELIESFKDSFDELLVYDNSEQGNQNEVVLNCSFYQANGKNDGLAKAYNMFIEYCVKEKIDFLCILDQDTMISIDAISQIKRCIDETYSEEVAIYAPRLKGTEEKDWVINSNSFLNISAISKKCMKYDEFYFLDRLDADFCKQVILKGLLIKIIEEVVVEHNIGEGKKREHSPVRHYYMFRNRLYFNLKYYNWFKAICLTMLQDLRHIGIILFRESAKKKKIIALLNGRRDYFSYAMQRRGYLHEKL